MLLTTHTLQAQVNLAGKVINKEGKPISGAIILLKGTDISTTTNNSGIFSVSNSIAGTNISIEVTAVGYKMVTQNVDANASNIVITLLSDVLNMDEVVVTGTSQGTTRKQIGSYIGTIKGDKIANAGTSNAIAALQGKVAGAQIIQNSGDPAGGMSVRLRGISTIGSSSDPLYIIDGVIINNSSARTTNTQTEYNGTGSIGQNRLVDINPNDIERIEVLNGAAAAATFGSRANAGVVQIFTKRGTSGKPQLSFTTRLGINQIRKKLTLNNAPTYFGPNSNIFTQDIIDRANTADTLSTIKTPVMGRYDYQDIIFRTAFTVDNSLSIRGGKDKSRYFSSLNFNNTDGIIDKTNNKRVNFRLNYDYDINKYVSITSGVNYTYNITTELPDGNTFFSPINAMTIIGNHHNVYQLDPDGNPKSVGERGRVNPLSIFRNIDQRNRTNRLITNIGVKFKPITGLTIDYMAGVDNINQVGTTLIKPFTYNVSPGFYGGGAALDPTQNGYASTGTFQSLFFNNDLNITYSTNLNANIKSTTQLGYSEQYERGNYALVQS
jgi:TonB-dependent SusC/RagA subfamily outer membrane receptor